MRKAKPSAAHRAKLAPLSRREKDTPERCVGVGAGHWRTLLAQPLGVPPYGERLPAQEYAHEARTNLTLLFDCAENELADDEALVDILRILDDFIAALWEVVTSEKDKDRFAGLLESRDCWPTLFPVRGKDQRKLAKEFKARGVGVLCESNPLGEYRDEAPITNYVKATLVLLVKLRRTPRNPPQNREIGSFRVRERQWAWDRWAWENRFKIPAQLTRRNWPKWGKLTTPLLRVFWGDEFHTHSDFAQYRNSAAYRSAKSSKVKAEIRRQWRATWKSLANPEFVG